jgi:hypothetical protein
MSTLEEMKEQLEKLKEYEFLGLTYEVIKENAIWVLEQRIKEQEAK